MLKKELILSFSILFSLCTYAQIETGRDTTSIKPAQQQAEKLELLEHEANIQLINNTEVLSPQELKHRIEFIRNQTFQLPEEYVGPIQEKKLGEIGINAHDYAFYNYTPIEDNLALGTASTHHSYRAIGASRQIVANLIYEASDRLTISGGMYVGKYTLDGQFAAPGEPISHYNDLGLNASLRFKIHERIYLKAHGAYSINSNDKNRNLPSSTIGMFPQTYFGGGVEYKVNSKFGIEGGMVRQLNPFNGKWKNTPYIMPVFYPFGR